jgi:hypothetical protein
VVLVVAEVVVWVQVILVARAALELLVKEMLAVQVEPVAIPVQENLLLIPPGVLVAVGVQARLEAMVEPHRLGRMRDKVGMVEMAQAIPTAVLP